LLLDRYLFQRIARPFVAVLVCVVAVLLLENLGRLLELLKFARDPIILLARFSLYLLPEYLGIGILLALFLSVALAIRSLTTSGEWQVFAATGVSPARLVLIPLILGMACAAAELGIHFHYRPAGEYALDKLVSDIREGLYGLDGEPRSMLRLDQDTMITADRFDRSTGRLDNVFMIRRGGAVFNARRAIASRDATGGIKLVFEDGQGIMPLDGGGFRGMRFGQLATDLRRDDDAKGGVEMALDRLPYDQLMHRVRLERARGTDKRSALASFASRCAYGAIALIIPFMALALGALPPRGRTPYGIGAGILAIVAYIRASAYVEGAAVAFPVIGFALLIGVCALGAFLIWNAEQRLGPGFVETWLARNLADPIMTRLGRAWARFRQ